MDVTTCDGWSAIGNRFHYFQGPRSLCRKLNRPKYCHPSPPSRGDACEACWMLSTDTVGARTASNGASWEEQAEAFIHNYALEHRFVLIDDVRGAGLPYPPGGDSDMRLVGPIFLKLKTQGVLRSTGRTYASAMAHGAPREVWESVIHGRNKSVGDGR